MTLRNPFTPGSSLAPPHLADRDAETKLFRECLRSTLDGAPRHMAVLGEWALGKTSLLLQCQRLADAEGALTVLKVANPESPAACIDSLGRHLGLRVDATYGASRPPRSAQPHDRPRYPPPEPELTLHGPLPAAGEAQADLRNRLRHVWGRGQQRPTGLLLLIDDLDRVKDVPRTTALLRRALAELGPAEARVMLVVSGAPDPLSSLTSTGSPSAPFSQTVELRRLTEPAMRAAVTRPIADTPMRFDDEVVSRIAELAAGHPYYLQELAYHTFELARRENRATRHTFELALEQTFYRISLTIFEPQIASLSAGEQRLLAVLVDLARPASHGNVVQAATEAGLNAASVPKLLRRLKAKGCVAQPPHGPDKRRYSVPDPLFREYVRRHVHSVN